MDKVIDLLVAIGILLFIMGMVFIASWEYDEKRCYNMPLNDFYNDPLCVRHTQTWEELNR